MLRRLCFGLAAIEAAILVFLLVAPASHPPGNAGEGGPEMAQFFFVQLPLVVLALAVAALYFGRRSRVVSGVAMLAIASPLVAIGAAAVRDAWINRGVAELQSGRGYFDAPAASELAEAIVRRDGAAVSRLAPKTDVNAAGVAGMTFLKLALDSKDFDLGSVQTLLAAGANPNQDGAWPVQMALYYGSAPLLAAVLAAGADPNTLDAQKLPVSFNAIQHPELIAQLLAGGAKIEAVDFRNRTMLLHSARERSWQAANVLLDHGANRQATDRDGKSALALLLDAEQEDRDNGRTVDPGLTALETRLRAGS